MEDSNISDSIEVAEFIQPVLLSPSHTSDNQNQARGKKRTRTEGACSRQPTISFQRAN